MNLAPGAPLGERYGITAIQQLTPAIFMGSATERTSGKVVAVHAFISNVSASPKWRENFLEDAARLAKLPDFGQPAVVEGFVADSLGVLVCQPMDGQPVLVPGQSQDPSTIVAWATDIASLLAHLHGLSSPVFGRSSRGETIWRRRDGLATLLRFGVPEPPVGTSFTKGVSPYQAPETFGNSPRQATVAADSYWLGTLMWTALTGKVPPNGMDRAAHKMALARPAGVPDELWQLIDTLAAMKPTDRPSAADLQRRLQRLPI